MQAKVGTHLPVTRSFIVRTLKYTLIFAIALLALTYCADYLSVQIRMRRPKPDDPLEIVTALRLLAIDEKGNKTEFMVDPVQPQQSAVCVHSLFPHFGNAPCWYVKRKFAQPIPMVLFCCSVAGRLTGSRATNRRKL